MAHDPYKELAERLSKEFAAIHPVSTVTRCVAAALHGAEDIVGSTEPDLVEKIARRHLRVLAIVAAERSQRIVS
ncbi:MAG: hypothetical protein ABIS86_10920 [Streptosporangiaceae bacterium]